MNTINIIGNIGKMEFGKTTTGMSVLNFSVAVKRNKDKTDWFNCVAMDKTAENLNNYFKVGATIGISGEMHMDTYVNKETNKTQSSPKLFVKGFSFCGSSRDDDEPRQQPQASQSKPQPRREEPEEPDYPLLDITADDLPF